MCLRIADRMRRVGWPRALVHADRPERARLEHPHELQSNHLEQGEECDDEAGAIADVREQLVEAERLALRQPREELIDPRLDGNLLRREHHLWPQLRAL